MGGYRRRRHHPVDRAVLTEEALKLHCRCRIADYKIPREVVFGPVPRNSTGKLQKALLREAAEQQTI